MPSSPSILITGANGLLGQHLAPLLQREGFRVLATGQGPSRLPAHIPYVSADLARAEDAARLARHPVQAVVHAGAITQVDICERDPELAHAVNVEGTRLLLDAFASQRPHWLYVSTDFVFDGEGEGLYAEDALPSPVNYYGQTKLEAERLVLAQAAGACIVRTVLVYGHAPGLSRSNIVLWALQALREGRAIRVVADQWRTPTLVQDLAQGCLLALRHRASGVYHVAGPDFLRPYDMALEVAAHFGLDAGLISPVTAETFREVGKRPLRTGFSIGKARRDWGYAPAGFREGLARLAAQLQEAG